MQSLCGVPMGSLRATSYARVQANAAQTDALVAEQERCVTARSPLLRIYSPPPTYGHCISGTPRTGTRAERMTGSRGCACYACPYNLAVVHSEDMPGRRYDGVSPPWTFDGESGRANTPSCALDMASTGPKRCAELEAKLGKHRRRWQQEVHAALIKWRDACVAAGVPEETVARDIGALLAQAESERRGER